MREYKYISHTGAAIEFNNGSGYWLDATPLRSYSNSYLSLNDRVSGFAPNLLKEKDITISVYGGSEREAAVLADRMLELFGKDIDAKKYGKLRINGYDMPCYIFAAESTTKLRKAKILKCKIVTDSWSWSKETKTVQYRNAVQIDLGLNSPDTPKLAQYSYPHDFPTGFANPAIEKTIENPNTTESEFRLTIFGAAAAPAITIAGNIYAVSTNIADGEKLVIDSKKMEVKLISESGAETNKFAERGREYDIFKKIPTGVSSVAWASASDLNFFLTIIDERRVPPWND